MKFVRLLTLPLLAAALVSSLSAQPAKTPVVKAVEPSRVAYLNSNAFLEPATGVKQLVKVMQNLELEFAPQQSELNLLQEKLRTIVGELQKLQAGGEANAQAFQEKQAEGVKLQQELQAKQQQAQQAFGQAQQQKQGPVMVDIGKALEAYAKAHDLGLLVDAAKLGDAVLYTTPAIDVTEDFIATFNAANP